MNNVALRLFFTLLVGITLFSRCILSIGKLLQVWMLALVAMEPSMVTIEINQLIVTTLLNNTTLIHHDNTIALAHCS